MTQENFNTTVSPATTETPVTTKPVVASAAQDHSCEKSGLKIVYNKQQFAMSQILYTIYIFSIRFELSLTIDIDLWY